MMPMIARTVPTHCGSPTPRRRCGRQRVARGRTAGDVGGRRRACRSRGIGGPSGVVATPAVRRSRRRSRRPAARRPPEASPRRAGPRRSEAADADHDEAADARHRRVRRPGRADSRSPAVATPSCEVAERPGAGGDDGQHDDAMPITTRARRPGGRRRCVCPVVAHHRVGVAHATAPRQSLPGAFSRTNTCSPGRPTVTSDRCPPQPPMRPRSSSAVPASTTCGTSTSSCRATSSSCSPACPGRASRAWRSTRSTPRASGATSRACQRLRPPVPRADGQARRRRHRGAVAGHLDRPEVGQPQPALDRRHDHRGLRLPAPALRPHRRAALPERRHPAAAPDPAADRRPGAHAARGHPLPGARAGRARPQGRVRDAARGPRRGRATCAPGSTARSSTSPTSSSATRSWRATSSTTSRSSSTASCAARGSSGGSPTRWRQALKPGRGRRPGRAGRPRATTARRARSSRSASTSSCPVCGTSLRRAGAAQLLVQLAVRRVRDVRRAGHAVRGRPGAARPRPRRVVQRRGDRPVAHGQHAVLHPHARGGRRRLRHRPRRAVRHAHRQAAEGHPRTASTATSRSSTRTATGACGSTAPRTRASSRGSSGATRAPRATGAASSTRATCASCRAPRAAAPG